MKSFLYIASSTWVGVLAVGLIGCLDFTPITAIPTDAATSDADSGPKESACLVCAGADEDAGGCVNEYVGCMGFSECTATVECVTAECFNPNANIVQCLGACEADGGLTSPGSPASVAFSAFLQCMSVHCRSACLQ